MKRSDLLLVPLFIISVMTAQESRSADAADSPVLDGGGQLLLPEGVTVSFVAKSDLWRVVNGGVAPAASFIGNADLLMEADLHEIAGLNGTAFFVHVLANNGGGVNAGIGDAQMVSNIEGYRTLKLYQCWFRQDLPEVGLSVLAGLFDLNSEFYVTPTSTLFLNGSHGIGIELSQSGMNGPSVFPNTALALRLRYALSDQMHLSAAVFDGYPGHPDDLTAFDVTLRNGDGLFSISEADYSWGGADKVAAGVWYFSGSYADVCAVEGLEAYSERRDNAGAYLLADLRLYSEPENSDEGLSVFSRFGFTNHHINPVQFHYGGGFTYTGLIDGRSEDQFGYAVALASFGPDFQRLSSYCGERTTAAETAHELTYRAVLTSWCSVQCDLQYIVHPSASLKIGNAFAAGFRVEAGL